MSSVERIDAFILCLSNKLFFIGIFSSKWDGYWYDGAGIDNSIEQLEPLLKHRSREMVAWISDPIHCFPCFAVTVRYRYNAVKSITCIHKRHPIARPSVQGMVCLLRIQHLIDSLPQFMELFMKYLTVLGRALTALCCNILHPRNYYSIS